MIKRWRAGVLVVGLWFLVCGAALVTVSELDPAANQWFGSALGSIGTLTLFVGLAAGKPTKQ